MVVVGCFLEFNGRFLILHRMSHKPNGDTWGLPAGKVDPGETEVAAMIRELYEETGYKATEEELSHLGRFVFGNEDSSYTFVVFKVVTDTMPNIVKEQTAHSEFKWVSAKECYAQTNLIPDFHELLEKLSFV